MKNLAWVLAVCLFMVIPLPAVFAHNDIDDLPINTAQELVEWCKNEVEQRSLGQDKIPRNWRVSHSVKGNYLHVRLTYKIEYDDRIAVCQVRKDAQRHYAIYQDIVESDEVKQ